MQSPQFQVHAAIEDIHWWFVARRHILRTLLADLLPNGASILDVGCGTGGNTAGLVDTYECIGVDPIPEAIDLAKKRYPGVVFQCGYAPEDVSDEIRTADAVLLMDVLEHIEDDVAFVSTVLSSMKSGAYLVIMAPADPTLWGPHDVGFEHYRRYTTERLSLLWKDLPVTECMLSYCNARLYPLVKVARMLTRFRGSALGPNDTDLHVPMRPVNAVFERIFRGESKRLLRVLQRKGRGYSRGVSVLAVVQKS